MSAPDAAFAPSADPYPEAMPVSRASGRPPSLHPYLDGPYPRAYAHRGWHLDELAGLENTAVAFRRAVGGDLRRLRPPVRPRRAGRPAPLTRCGTIRG